MQCQVLLFAQLAESVGRERLTLTLGNDATGSDALEQLASEHAVIKSMAGQIAVAVDERYQPLDAPLHDGCTIALIPPVSGG